MEYYGKATNSKEKTEEATAREILALTLLGASQEKHTNSDYDENGWLNAYIKEQNKEHVIDINENIVSIDGWEFEIDRSIPAIKGEGTQSRKDNSIQIKLKQVVHVTLKKLKIEIETEKEIKTLTVNENVIETIPEKTNGKYIIEKEVEGIGKYEIKAIASDDTWNTASIEITEEIPIYDKEDMETFRDLVNSGSTFEGKTVTLKNNIDLEGNNENQWTPIGTNETQFQGIFDGNDKTIGGLYMDRGDLKFLGLFYSAPEVIIKKLKIENCYINSTWNDANNISGWVAGLVGHSIKNAKQCSVTGSLSCNYKEDVIVNTRLLGIGGIVGYASTNQTGSTSNIEECYNGANLLIHVKKTSNTAKELRTGGIVASGNNVNIINCYNTGNITTITTNTQTNRWKGGILGLGGVGNIFISDCYNVGTISEGGDVGGILGKKNVETCSVNNSYYLNTCGGNNTNGGIALTQEQIQTPTFANILNKKETYSNTLDWTSKYQEGKDLPWGYKENRPILKWQMN